VKALLVIDGNPLFTLPEQDKLRSALGSVPFIASFSSFLDETAAMADLILPNHVPLERWIDDVPEPGVGFPVRTVAGPAVQPRWETRDTGDVLLKRPKTIGGKTAEALPFENMAAAIKESFRSVHAVNAGNVTDPDFDAFYKKVTEAGGWWNEEGLRAQGQGSGTQARQSREQRAKGKNQKPRP
jgi:anaerobic selenocysteine-containing dehydrogenase